MLDGTSEPPLLGFHPRLVLRRTPNVRYGDDSEMHPVTNLVTRGCCDYPVPIKLLLDNVISVVSPLNGAALFSLLFFFFPFFKSGLSSQL